MCYDMSDIESLILIQAILMECTIINSIIGEFPNATGWQEEEDGKLFVRDKHDKVISYMSCHDLH